MNKFKITKIILFIGLMGMIFQSCTKVPAGHVGIKFYLLGKDKGVNYDVLEPGRYHIGINKELYKFPTFTQNYVWTASADEGSENDESFTFQDKQGLELSADIGITYHLQEDKIPLIFETYKRGIDEITDLFLRNMVRDALVTRTSTMDVQYIYGEGRGNLIDSIQYDVMKQCTPLGIIVDKLYWIGSIRLPQTIKDAIDAKINATNKAQQRENELREAEADAKKKIAKADGEAQSIILKAKAEAEANKLITNSITDRLIKYEKIKKWDGKLPTVSGSGATIVDLK